eukprot:m.506610 g.506610  ORF g.506610 m.506610 type:complete len:501 (+) comp21875_c0_seq3:240-1742(+)
MVKLVVKRIDGRCIQLDNLPRETTTAEIKELIQKHMGNQTHQQRLFIQQNELVDDTCRPFTGAMRNKDMEVIHLVPKRRRTANSGTPRQRSDPKAAQAVDYADTSSMSRSESSSSCQSLLEKCKLGSDSESVVIPRVNFTHISVLEVIGNGSYKTVHRGKFGSHPIALLTFRKDTSENSLLSEVLAVAEATSMARLQPNPHVIKFFGLAIDPRGDHCILCEYAPRLGFDTVLEQYATRPRADHAPVLLPPRVSERAAYQICNGMASVVRSGLVHRDVALRNIMCCSFDADRASMLLKIGDFGRAVRGPAHVADAVEDSPLRWAAPEVLEQRMYTESSDVWAFAVTVWEIASLGALPFGNMDDAEVVSHVRGGSAVLLPKTSSCPVALYEILGNCWQLNPTARPTFANLSNVLLGYAGDETDPDETDAPSGHMDVVIPSEYVPVSVLQGAGSTSDQLEDDEGFGLSVHHLVEMGFDAVAARRELRACSGDIDTAISNLLQA